jgi:hypothetical protein
MRLILILTVCLAGACANPPLEKIMNLNLEATITKKGKETVVTASMKNRGTVPAKLLLEFMAHRTFAIVKDSQGREIPPSQDASASRGARMFKAPLRVHVLQPGEAVEIGAFSLLRSPKRAFAGDLSWELAEVSSESLTVEMGYEVTEGHAGIAKDHQAADVAVGRWTAPPVALPLPQ